jgi:DNA-binding transcriptional regulator YiaG
MVAKRATNEESFHYTMSGLRNVFLVGINYKECPICHEKVPEIPKMEELHKVIANVIIKKPEPLNGEEIRYLRKNAGFNGSDFAAMIGLSAAHLSRAENNRLNLGPTADKMVRSVAEAVSGGEQQVRDILLEKAKRIKRQRIADRRVFKLGGNRWQQLELVA